MAGISITADSSTEFTANTAEYESVCRLDDNTFVVVYRDNSDFNKGKAIVGTRSGTSITISEANAVTFDSSNIIDVTVKALSSTKIIITYVDDTANAPYAIIGTISGTSITFGSRQVLGADGGDIPTIAILDGSNVVFCFADAGGTDAVECYVASISGTSISVGSVQGYTYSQLIAHPVAAVGLDSTHFAFAYSASSNAMFAVIGSVNTGAQTITFGTAKQLDSNSENYWQDIIIDKFDSTHFLVGWKDDGIADTNLRIAACVYNTSTLAITEGKNITVGSSGTDRSDYSLCTMGASNFLVAWYTANGTQAEIRGGTLTGSTDIAWDTQGAVTFDNGTSAYTSLCSLTSTYFLLGYKKG